MDYISSLLVSVFADFVRTLHANWPYLLLAVVVASVLRTYVGTSRIESALSGRPWITIPAAVLLSAVTPFCSCGTEAVVLGMMAGAVTWAPIIAFMVSSPLTSPEELLYSAGLFGRPFAVYYFVVAIVIGLAAGLVAHIIERSGWLQGQARMQIAATRNECCTPTVSATQPTTAGAATRCDTSPQLANTSCNTDTPPRPKPRWATRFALRTLLNNLWSVGRRLGGVFHGFRALGVPRH